MSSRHPTWELFYALERDLRAASAKLATLGTHLAQLDLADTRNERCAYCGLVTKGPRTLAEHLYVSHGGPVPDSWQEADKLAG